MKIVSSRFLRGPNVHSMQPCVLSIVDLEALSDVTPSALPGFEARLLAALPALARPDGALPWPARGLADVVGAVAGGLQSTAGTPVAFSRALPVLRRPGQHWIACGYEHEAVAEQAMAVAIHAVSAWAADDDFDLGPRLDALRSLVAARAIDAASRALIEIASARGIPVLRLEDAERRFQLGWGCRQRRFEAGNGTQSADAKSDRSSPVARARSQLETLFPEGANGRIPTVAITGTNGKTTTAQLLAYALRTAQSGRSTVGTTTTQAVYIGERVIERGDCTGYWSARRVLTDDGVDAAVLETARGGILKRGLAFDRCDVGVVLNVSADHLGLDGVETLADLAVVKGLVARCAARAAVLNAEDPSCVAMANTLQPGCVPTWFAMDANNAWVTEHRERGGAAAWLGDDGWLMLANGGHEHRLLEAARMPIAMQGHARYNIANALAAAAALMALDLEPAAIGSALADFVSDARSNPLRSNCYSIAGKTVVVDYGHNMAAYRALCEMARSMLRGRGGRLIGVVTAPGDRRAGDLFEVGALCGEGFDELVVYEQDPRGRSNGETAAAILAGARSTAGAKPLHGIPPIRDAFAHGLGLAGRDDIVIFTCAGTLDDAVDGIRRVDPAAADRLAAEIAA
ncbi:Mur ligase family protein [Methylibium sp.]|uniref:Mur ligase family protein n=1 Tax=Methylibium sp. TaxID=2067992 RepID=UPI0017D9C664|nr:Mur ligase family protein [Methylibium sp.]MBA3590949.1 hypothetical protein [Methylibium sp.]